MKFIKVIALLIALLPSQLPADSSPNNSELWNAMTDDARVAFLIGYKQGFDHGAGSFLLVIARQEATYTRDSIWNQARYIMDYSIDIEKIDFETLSKTITSIYSDPANSYISYPEMISIAKCKVGGEPIEDKLLDARKGAIKEHELLEEYRNKFKK